MNCRIKLPGKPLSADELKAFEQRHWIVFPEDYRRFMLEYNGGLPDPDLFVAKGGLRVQVARLYRILDNFPHDMDRTCRCLDWPKAYDLGIMRIGSDMGGSGIFLCTKADAGAVYFLDWREQPKSPVRIANSFTELMSNLCDD